MIDKPTMIYHRTLWHRSRNLPCWSKPYNKEGRRPSYTSRWQDTSPGISSYDPGLLQQSERRYFRTTSTKNFLHPSTTITSWWGRWFQDNSKRWSLSQPTMQKENWTSLSSQSAHGTMPAGRRRCGTEDPYLVRNS